MPQDRFEMIMKYWHFSDNCTFNQDTHPCPKLQKLYELIEYLCNKFRKTLVAEKM